MQGLGQASFTVPQVPRICPHCTLQCKRRQLAQHGIAGAPSSLSHRAQAGRRRWQGLVRGSDDVQQVLQQVLASAEPQQFTPPTNQASGFARGPPGGLLPGHILAGKYQILGVLGSGSNAITYQARMLGTQHEVAVKALSLRSLRDWKQLDLFQREAQILAGLSHPAIPRYLEYFEDDSEGDRMFYLVQEVVVGGRSLQQMVSGGMRASQEEVMRIAGELLRVLSYLGSLSPPVTHRDVKPENLVVQGGQWGGKVFLVDFGGVQAAAALATAESQLGSTIVGTYGYMAPEQFRGAAAPASDLYAAGATLLYLVSGQPPSAFPQERMRIAWRAALGAQAVPPRLAALLDGLLEPLAEERMTADDALALLEGRPLAAIVRGKQPGRLSATRFERRRAASETVLRPPQTPQEAMERMVHGLAEQQRPVPRPTGTRVVCERSPARLDITIPPKGLTGDTVFTGGFALVWNAFVATWTFGALASGGLLFALFSTPFWFAGAQLARTAFGGALLKERFAVGQSRWRLAQQLAVFGRGGSIDFLDDSNSKSKEGRSSDLQGARVITTAIVNDMPQTCIEVVEGVNRLRFGEGLVLQEQQWLVGEINAFLADGLGREVEYESLPAPDLPSIIRDTDTD